MAGRTGCYSITLPGANPAALVISSPHSGTHYTTEFLNLSRLDMPALRRSEDCYINEIFGGGPDAGAIMIAADFPRAWCDVNREAWELDQAMFGDTLPAWVNTASARVVSGLGTIARVVSNGETIYRGKLRFADAQERVQTCWQPYHDALARLIAQISASQGACLLMDCHSMPAHACQDRRPVPDIVLGDVHGAACVPAVMRAVDHFLSRRGYVVRRNDPYAGGYITRHYGNPSANVHALQIEIARGLYMNETSLEKTGGFTRVQADMKALSAWLAEQALPLMRGLPG